MIRQSQAEFAVKVLCQVLKVSRSGYYDCLGRSESERQKADKCLKGEIRQIWEHKRQHYGYPRIHAELVAVGWQIGRKRVARLIQQMGLQAKKHRPFKPKTTLSDPSHEVASNRVGISKPMPRTRNGWWTSRIWQRKRVRSMLRGF